MRATHRSARAQDLLSYKEAQERALALEWRADLILLAVPMSACAEVLEVDLGEWRVARRFPTGSGPYNLEVTEGALLA